MIFNYIKWLLVRSQVEENVLRFCELEYKETDVNSAFIEAMSQAKYRAIYGGSNV